LDKWFLRYASGHTYRDRLTEKPIAILRTKTESKANIHTMT